MELSILEIYGCYPSICLQECPHKNLKIQNGRHFGRDTNFLKIGIATLQRYPVSQKFRRNHSISHGFRDIRSNVLTIYALRTGWCAVDTEIKHLDN